MFLRKEDLYTYLRSDNLAVIIEDHPKAITEALIAAEAQVTSYLRNYHDVAAIFITPKLFGISDTYTTGDLIYWEPALYAAASTYDTGDYATYNNVIYRALEDTITGVWNAAKWAKVADFSEYYTVVADTTGNYPTHEDFFSLADNRDAQIKMYVADIAIYHIHARINPRQLPQFRADRRDEAIDWLKAIQEGKVTSGLPVRSDVDTVAGQNIIFGGNEKKTFQW